MWSLMARRVHIAAKRNFPTGDNEVVLYLYKAFETVFDALGLVFGRKTTVLPSKSFLFNGPRSFNVDCCNMDAYLFASVFIRQ